MTPICLAITKHAPRAYVPREAHPCRNQVWRDGYCKVHHPVLRLGRLGKKRVAIVKALQRVDDEIAEVKKTGVEATDLPGQLRMFDSQPKPAVPEPLFATA